MQKEKVKSQDIRTRQALVDSIYRLSHHLPKTQFYTIVKRAQENVAINEKIPYVLRTSIIMLVDISGFTKLSTRLSAEKFSKVINDYFELIITEIDLFGGEILKFAGDAVFVEWQVQHEYDMHQQSPKFFRNNKIILDTIMQAISCAYNIILKCCDYEVACSEYEQEPVKLNVHCGLGFGRVIHMHAGNTVTTNHISSMVTTTSPEGTFSHEIQISSHDNNVNMDALQRREYIVFGEAIDQVALAVDKADDGQVCVSSQVFQALSAHEKFSMVDSNMTQDTPLIISKSQYLLSLPLLTVEEIAGQFNLLFRANIDVKFTSLKMSGLLRLRDELILYAHQVIRYFEEDIFEVTQTNIERIEVVKHSTFELENMEKKKSPNFAVLSDKSKELQGTSLDEYAELRSLYTIFVMPLVSTKILFQKNQAIPSINERQKILEIVSLLDSIYEITLRELLKYGGQLLQYIVDDKGVVLVATFGLRGSTFPHMISERGLPATMSIRRALDIELDIDANIGATTISNRAYCGLVGSKTRHTYSAMGPSINLAARLMSSPKNQGILVNDAVRRQCDNRFLFDTAMAPIKAKGYLNPVQIFEPLSILENKWRKPRYFVGRHSEIMSILSIARSTTAMRVRRRNSNSMGTHKSKIILVSGESGIGKSSMVYQALKKIQQMDQRKKRKKISIIKTVCEEGDEYVPFSACRQIFSRLLGSFEGDHITDNISSVDSPSQSMIDAQSMRRLSEISISSEQIERLVRTDCSHIQSDTHSEITEFSTFSGSSINLTLEFLQAICEKRSKSEEFSHFLASNIFGLSNDLMEQTGNDENIKSPKESEIIDFFLEVFSIGSYGKNLIVLAIDDIQWMDSSSLKVIEGLYERVESLLMILISRNEDCHATNDFFRKMQMELRNPLPRFKHIHLGSVSIDETKQLISRFVHKAPDELDVSLCSNIYEQSAGMPFFAIEILSALKRENRPEEKASNLNGNNNRKSEIDENKAINNHVSKIKSFSSLGVLFLRRLDCFSANSKAILQLCALLGFEFNASDICQVYNSLMIQTGKIDASPIKSVINTLSLAVQEGIFVESYQGQQNKNSEEKIEAKDTQSDEFESEQERLFSFAHSVWRSTLIDNMLKEKKQNLHKYIADSIELDRTKAYDLARFARSYRHRRDSGDKIETTEIAFFLSSHFDKMGSFDQTLILMKETLDLWSVNLLLKDDDVRGMNIEELKISGGLHRLQFNNLLPTDLMKITQLLVVSGRCLGGVYQGLAKFAAFCHAYHITIEMLQLPSIPKGQNPFAVFSGLLLCLKCGPVPFSEKAAMNFEQKLASDFVLVAKKNGEVAHICRALAAQSQTFAKFGDLNRAIYTQKVLENIYSPAKCTSEITKLYGSDRAAQNFGLSTLWFDLINAQKKVHAQIDIVLYELLPQMDHQNVHNTFMLIYPVMNAMKKHARGLEAYNLFKLYVVAKFDTHFGEGKSTFFLPLYKPILILYQLLRFKNNCDGDDKICSQYNDLVEWVLKKDQGQFSRHMESGVVPLGQDGKTIVAEICLILAMRCEEITREKKEELISKGILLAKESLATSYAAGDLCNFARRESQIVLSALGSF